MTKEKFNAIIALQIKRCTDILQTKSNEYATEDSLHNFRIAAELQNCTMEQALAGMMIKHTVSVCDMINSGKEYPDALWEEKVTDHINYLLMLMAVVKEGK